MYSILIKQLTSIAGLAFILAGPVAAQPSIDKQPIVFEEDRSGAMIESSLRGDQIVDYVVTGVAGQYMTVDLDTDNSANYFNVMAPGEEYVAFFIGSSEGNHFEGALPADGDYTLRVYLMRSAARRDEQAHFTLNVAVTTVDDPDDSDALVSGTEYNAMGETPCVIDGADQSCPFGVIRHGGGSATVVVTLPDGSEQRLEFKQGEAVAPDAGEFSSAREADDSLVTVNGQSYRIPDAVVFGG